MPLTFIFQSISSQTGCIHRIFHCPGGQDRGTRMDEFLPPVFIVILILCLYLTNLSLIQMDSPLPPVQKLVVPAAASVSGNRSVSFRPTLTPGGVSRPLDRTPRETVRNTFLRCITTQHNTTLFLCIKYSQIELNTNLMLNLLLFHSLSPQDNHHNYLTQAQAHLKGKTVLLL